MIFACANCRKIRGRAIPGCPTCTAVQALLTSISEPRPMFISVAPEPEPIPEPKRKPKFSWELESNQSKPLLGKEPPNFPVLEHRWHDYPPDYPYFEDFKLSHEELSYMKTQVEVEFDNMPEIDSIPDPIGIYWIRKHA